MTTNQSKEALLLQLEQEHAGFKRLLDEIGEARMNEPGVAGEWSMKDIVAHLTGWRRRTVARFQAALKHEPEPASPWPTELQDDDEINAWMYAADRDRPLADILHESDAVFQQLLDTLRAFPEAALREYVRSRWASDEPLTGAAFFSHFHDEHEAGMRAWLEKQRA